MRCSQPFRSKFQIVYINEILADLLLKTTHQQHSRWTDWHFIYNKQRNMWVGHCFSSWWHHVWLRYWTPIAINMCMHMPHWQGKDWSWGRGGGGWGVKVYYMYSHNRVFTNSSKFQKSMHIPVVAWCWSILSKTFRTTWLSLDDHTIEIWKIGEYREWLARIQQ